MKFILLQKKIPLECGKPLELVSKIKLFCFQNYFCCLQYCILQYLEKSFRFVKLILVLGFTPNSLKKYLVLQLANTKHEKSALENEVC